MFHKLFFFFKFKEIELKLILHNIIRKKYSILKKMLKKKEINTHIFNHKSFESSHYIT